MLNQILAIQCPKCLRYYTEQQLKAAFINNQSITFKCQESNGEGCGSVIQAEFYMKPIFEKVFSLKRMKKIDNKIGEQIAVTVKLRDGY